MKRKGFTLIELLAVIVILAIIALIATPKVLDIIDNSKEASIKISVKNYLNGVEQAISLEDLNGKVIKNGKYYIMNNGNICSNELVDNKCSETEIKIDVKGNKPTSGIIFITDGTVIGDTTLIMSGYYIKYDEDKNEYLLSKIKLYDIEFKLTNINSDSKNEVQIKNIETKTLIFKAPEGYNLPYNITVIGAQYTWDKTTGTLILSKATDKVIITINGVEIKTFKNGEVVYFNVDTGTKCSNYTETQSNTGVNSGCMKFYAFNDDGGDKVNLILDHNTTALIAWNSSGRNTSGPNEVLTQLKTDTYLWQGTETPSNYTNTDYTVDYNNYKARIITANEIAKITGNTEWDETTATDFYYFDSKTTTESSTCTEGRNTTGCQYGWLYDRTHISCTDYGCLNNADSTTTSYMHGYWSVSSSAGDINYAWYVDLSGLIDNRFTVDDSDYHGVRPVIEVLKSKLN